ncbi:MAG: exodeoxyribonuclease VII small subunit [Abitibacteriaceae bacterium]|nr:exodeoxyribonuclease VII small subunit [Abditibacteriaceae bacterium]MBV9864241.1 exodeoxyribonuclease VII small subunit [Abditibacteriaceae bacterium]
MKLKDKDLATEESTGEELSFEDALRELEEVVSALETGNVPLEQSIALLQRGMALAEQCDNTLNQAEAALEQLVATADGELVTQPIEYDTEEDED